MLETLSIKNIAIIDSAEVRFRPGLNILSGETGAGKSIVIESISLVLGSRASVDFIRTGSDEASVEALFDLKQLPWLKKRLEEHGFEASSGELLIKRVIGRNGKNRIHVNGQLATLALLQSICEDLVDICGQHEHQSLLKAKTQLDLLDRYGELENQVTAYSEVFSRYQTLLRERDSLLTAEAERARRADFLNFQIEELRAAGLQPGEDDSLQSEKKLLQSVEARVQAVESAREALEGEDAGILQALRGAGAKLRALEKLDPACATMLTSLERALAEVEDLGTTLSRYAGAIDTDPNRLAAVQERLALIADFRRKYGPSVAEMLETLAKLEKEQAGLGEASRRLSEIESELATTEGALRKAGKKLSASRRKAAAAFSELVTKEVRDLKMGDAKLSLELTERENIADWTASGADGVELLVQTNRGEPPRPLSKIASGGELSRIMLGIRRVIADRGGIGVYLFDEIDAGIGGQTAFQVGKKLKSVAAFNQVICITHLPQVASFADHHLAITKTSEGKRTRTSIIELSAASRKEELARMLGGPALTKKSLENAAELLQLARP